MDTAWDEVWLRWGMGILISVGLTLGLRHRLRVHRRGGGVSRRGEGRIIFAGLRLSALFLWGVLFLWLLAPGWLPGAGEKAGWARLGVPEAGRWAGLALGWACVPLFAWMFTALGDNLTDTVAVRPMNHLVTDGPYRFVRHPMYAFGILWFVALVLVTNHLFILIFGVVAMIFLLMRTPLEESQLLARHGAAYAEYCNRVGRYVPRIFPRRRALFPKNPIQ